MRSIASEIHRLPAAPPAQPAGAFVTTLDPRKVTAGHFVPRLPTPKPVSARTSVPSRLRAGARVPFTSAMVGNDGRVFFPPATRGEGS